MPRKAKDPNETREQTFLRLATTRVNKVINDIRLIGNLGSYPSTLQQRTQMLSAIHDALSDVEYRLGGEKKVEKKGFSFAGAEGDDF